MELSSYSNRPERQEPPFHLTIRFTTGHEDLNLDIPSPSRTNILQLKQQIRKQLPEDVASNRIRLIHGGKVLHDAQILSSCLKAPPPPPPSTDRKGKAPELPPPRIYINLAVGDKLSEADLAEEGKEAKILSTINTSHQPSHTQTTPQPRGFDRFLDTMPVSEVADLRAQFLARLANQHTPDTMPTPTTQRRLEDEWIDQGADATGTTGLGTLGSREVEGELDDFFWGTLMGFLWPVGMLGFGAREGAEGPIWSDRRKMAIWTGVMISLGFGIVREMSYNYSWLDGLVICAVFCLPVLFTAWFAIRASQRGEDSRRPDWVMNQIIAVTIRGNAFYEGVHQCLIGWGQMETG